MINVFIPSRFEKRKTSDQKCFILVYTSLTT